MRWIVFDAVGVLYDVPTGDDVIEFLVPFLRSRDVAHDEALITRTYRSASLGEFDSHELWRRLGLEDGGPALDSAYLAGHRVVPRIAELLTDLRDRGVSLGCISNDVAAWSLALRELHHLDDLIQIWTISSDVGVRKPDQRIFQMFLKDAGCVATDCMLIDDRRANVDVAAELGFAAVLADFGRQSDLGSAVQTVDELRALIDRWLFLS